MSVGEVHTWKLREVPGRHCAFAILVISVEFKLPVYFTDTPMVFAVGDTLFQVRHEY